MPKTTPKGNEEKRRRFTGKQIISIIVILMFTVVLTLAVFLPDEYLVGTQKMGYIITRSGTTQSHIYPETPPISYRYEVTFKTTGAISVNNPVHVTVFLKEMNISNFLDYFGGVTFVNAYSYPIDYHENQTMNSLIINVTEEADGTYYGEADVVWLIEGPTYLSETLKNPAGQHVPIDLYDNSSVKPVITVSSVSDTLTTQFTATTNRLALIVGSFGVIVMQPILEAIFLKEKPIPNKPPKEEPPK
jgi:hypothetical protein